jgi:hypothetical protein
MAYGKITPLEPKAFFTGIWTGDGELCPHPLVRWLFPKERFHLLSRPTWLSEDSWIVTEQFVFESGNTIERKMSVRIIAPDRLHVTADDMPSGVDVLLRENGFRFTPYYILVRHRGIRCRLKCLDENLVDDDGIVHDTIKMSFYKFPVAVMRFRTTVRRTTEPS